MTITFGHFAITSGPSASLTPTYLIEVVRSTPAAFPMSSLPSGHQS